MIRNLLGMIFLWCVISANAQTFAWEKGFVGNNPYSQFQGKSVAIDDAGNVYATGTLTQKLDPNGNVLWGPSVSGLGIAVDQQGNVYTTGIAYNLTDFDPGPGVYNVSTIGYAPSFVYVCKLDANGNFLWAKGFGETNVNSHLSHKGNAIAVNSNGDVIVTGEYSGSVDFDPGAPQFIYTSIGGDTDVFVVRLNSNGDMVWAKTLGGSNGDKGYGLSLDGSDNVYLTGYFQGTADFDPGAGISNLVSVGGTDVFACKLTSTGDFVWAKAVVSGATSNDIGYGIKVSSNGKVFITGQFFGSANFNPAGVAIHSSNGGADIFLTKLDANGNWEWAKTFGSSWIDVGYSVTVLPGGNVYVTGGFDGTVDFDPSTDGVYNLTGGDIFLLGLSTDGDFVSASKRGRLYASDYGYSIAANSNSIVIAGKLGSTGLIDGSSTYKIVYKYNLAPLPVTLINFEVIQKQEDIFLSWQTATETNSDRFEIQMSEDGNSFRKIDEVRAAGNSSDFKMYKYTHIDAAKSPSIKTLFYRLKQIDLDGKFEYSPVRSINLIASNNELKVYPNPANNQIIITAEDLQSGKQSFRIINQTGQLMLRGNLERNTTTINISHLVPGVYYLQIDGDNTKSLQFIRQ